MRAAIAFLFVAVVCGVAHADEAEAHVSVAPGVGLLLRHGNTNIGFGGRASAGFGVTDLLDVTVDGGCDRFAALERHGVTSSTGIVGSVVYDTLRCSLIPGIGLRFGQRLVGSADFGVGYRLERRTNRELGADGILLERLDARMLHQAVVRVRLGAAYRVSDVWAVGVVGDLVGVVAGGKAEADVSLGFAGAAFFYF